MSKDYDEIREHLRLAMAGIGMAIGELSDIHADMCVRDLERVRDRVQDLIFLIDIEIDGDE